MDRSLFWELLITWRCLRGEFFILPLDANDQPIDLSALPRSHAPTLHAQSSILNSPSSPIKRLITLPPESFYHVIQGHDLAGWRFTGSPLSSPIASQVLLPEEVIHSRSPNPYLYWRGMSPLLLATLPAASDYAAEQFMKGLMLNNADTGVIVTTDQQVSAEQRAETLAALRARKRSAGTADRPLFLWGGTKIERPAVTSADLQFLENRKLNRQQIGAIFKVPESLMGFTDQKNALSGGSSIEQERLNFIQNTIASHCARLEAALAPIIRTFGHDLIGYFDLECLPAMQQARRARWETATKALAAGVPLNELNSLFDLGLKHLPWGKTPYISTSLQPIDTNDKSPSPGGEGRGEGERPFSSSSSASASSSNPAHASRITHHGPPLKSQIPNLESSLSSPSTNQSQSEPSTAAHASRITHHDSPFSRLADLLHQLTHPK
jgi:phage portal protein BeeE